ncbi:MAG TPA: lysophospholipid acyltransferase family protein [Oxalicibacterium sp.]|uniref:lysophospholipid acyltransferase family protein n=1 Tax=Oxalicibacterium sp. TaxID=2766525 RepID=UPI002BF23705|nr:lysophospholipid acyltransferase family protein [Oxalicibacterium sp.]HWU98056.1 lysophospholipid acyltransferase family protein [Oxalicibacterium sp.]
MIAWVFLRVMLHLLAGLATAAVVFPWVNAANRDRRIKRWSIGLLTILRIRVEVRAEKNAVHQGGELIVANHVSWLDIFVLNSLQPCRFVAKADIRSWPALGWLCEKSGTVFIARGKQREIRHVYEGLVVSLKKGERIAFFPEGTTAAQGTLLPFHPNLFEAAIEANVPVQPYALRYVDEKRNLHGAADFIGDMTFVDSMLLIMRSGRMMAQLMPLPLIDSTGMHRRDLAVAARQSIAAGLGYVVEAERSV